MWMWVTLYKDLKLSVFPPVPDLILSFPRHADASVTQLWDSVELFVQY